MTEWKTTEGVRLFWFRGSRPPREGQGDAQHGLGLPHEWDDLNRHWGGVLIPGNGVVILSRKHGTSSQHLAEAASKIRIGERPRNVRLWVLLALPLLLIPWKRSES